MCGLAAIITPDFERKAEFSQQALSLLQHRGPDGQGSWQDTHVGLIHTRLAILDLSEAGHQPMRSFSGRYFMVYNGEVYNHLELRQKYFPNRQWQGHSDTETLLALFEKLGTAMFADLVGMWALAIWDTKEKRLLLSRGRYGQKPLYYRFYEDGSFAAASEIKPLLIEGEKNRANPLMVAEYLALGNYDHLAEQTFFADVQQLLPATYCWIKPGQRQIHPITYWELPVIPYKERIPAEQNNIEQLQALLVEAVQSQTLSDVPIGATLSGGIDSSLITGILATYTTANRPIDVFTAQSPGSRWDESRYVRAVQEKWGGKIRLHTKNLNEFKLSDHLEQALYIQEEPFGDPSILAHGFLMDMAKEAGVKVVLGGQGADEIFFGYPHNIQQLLSYEWHKGNWGYVWNNIRQSPLMRPAAKRIVLAGLFPKLEQQLRLKSRRNKRHFLSKELIERAQAHAKEHGSMHLATANDWRSILEESIRSVHIPHLVHYDDRNAMARSIEGRMPFLDHRLLEVFSQIQPSDIFVCAISKFLLRKAGKSYLPTEIMNRNDKIGFFTPIHEMLHEEIKWVEKKATSSASWVDWHVIRGDIDFYATKESHNERSRRLWRVLSLNCWVELFNVTI